jgi:hypothetical protein
MYLATLLVSALSAISLATQADKPATAEANRLTTVRITTAVMAGGTSLPAGTYELRLTGQSPVPVGDEQRHVREWVEFVANGKVVAREVAEILYDDYLPSVGASSQKVPSGTRVEMLKGGEFLRISVKRENVRYLIYLPPKAD